MESVIDQAMFAIEDLKSEGHYDEAHAQVTELLKTYTDDYRCYEQLADILVFQGRQLEALSAVTLALSLHAESATGNYLAGFIRLGLGHFEEAVPFLKISNELSPNNPEVLRHLGWAYVMSDHLDQGIILLQRALTMAPDDELIMEDLGMALLALGNHQEGVDYLRKSGKNALRIEEIELLMRSQS